MNRTLRMSSRPFIVFAILLGPLEILMLLAYLQTDRSQRGLGNVLLFPVLYAILMLALASVRVTV